jgi:hypothetical protein
MFIQFNSIDGYLEEARGRFHRTSKLIFYQATIDDYVSSSSSSAAAAEVTTAELNTKTSTAALNDSLPMDNLTCTTFETRGKSLECQTLTSRQVNSNRKSREIVDVGDMVRIRRGCHNGCRGRIEGHELGKIKIRFEKHASCSKSDDKTFCISKNSVKFISSDESKEEFDAISNRDVEVVDSSNASTAAATSLQVC